MLSDKLLTILACHLNEMSTQDSPKGSKWTTLAIPPTTLTFKTGGGLLGIPTKIQHIHQAHQASSSRTEPEPAPNPDRSSGPAEVEPVDVLPPLELC